MHHHRIPTLFHPLQLLAHPPLAHAHLLGRLALTQHPVPGPFQPFQLVPFLLAHLDSFHPSALRLSRGTFYLAQLGTFHLAATFRMVRPSFHASVGYNRSALSLKEENICECCREYRFLRRPEMPPS